MFSQVFVCPQGGVWWKGGVVKGGVVKGVRKECGERGSGRYPLDPKTDNSPGSRGRLPRPPQNQRQTLPGRDDHWSGRYESYWNAFLFELIVHRHHCMSSILWREITLWTFWWHSFTSKCPRKQLPLCTLKSVSNYFKWNIRSLTKYLKINCTGIGGNSMTKFVYYPILANILILKLK